MLKKRVRLKTEELRLVNEILKALAKAPSVEKAFERVLQIFYSLWGIDAGFIALKEGENGKLRIYTAFGLLPSEIERAIYTKGEGITGMTYKLGIPLYATEDELLNKTGLVERLKGKRVALFTAPIKAGDEILGVLALFRDEQEINQPVERILETLSVIGSILGTFIQLKADESLPFNLTYENLKKLLLSGKLEGEFLLSSRSPKFKNLLNLLDRVKNSPLPLCFFGEGGSGKATLARFLHYLSKYSDKPLEVIDFRNHPDKEEVLNPDLWNGERALLLRHINLIPVDLQKEILKRLAKKEIKLYSTTTEDLWELSYKGKFLESLRNLLCALNFRVPSLRERKEDIPNLVYFFEEKYRTLFGAKATISREVIQFLKENPPKGNIKHLEELIKSLLLIFGNRERIHLHHLESLYYETHQEVQDIERKETPAGKKFTELLEEEEKRKILEALEKTNYVKSRAAKLLGYTLRQLDYRLKKYGIDIKRQK